MVSHPAAAVIDVSNACWSAELPPHLPDSHRPVLERLAVLIEAWRSSNGRDAPLRLVADASLRHCLSGPDRARWPQLVQDLEIETVAVADERILEYAATNHIAVLSRDRFIDHRRSHPWIEERPERFLRWRYVDGAVIFMPLGIVPEPHQVVSRHEEAKELKRVGLDRKRHRDILLTRWRCVGPQCIQARLWQDALLLWPMVDKAGRAYCPSCRGRLTPAGRRSTTRQVIVSAVDQQTEILRFPIEHGTPVVVGRGRLDNGVSLDRLPRTPPRIGRLSRQHVVLSLRENGVLDAVDLGSTNGSAVHADDGTPMARSRLVAHQWERLAEGSQLWLAGVVRLELSGRRFLVDTRRPAEADREAAGVTDVGAGTENERVVTGQLA